MFSRIVVVLVAVREWFRELYFNVRGSLVATLHFVLCRTLGHRIAPILEVVPVLAKKGFRASARDAICGWICDRCGVHVDYDGTRVEAIACADCRSRATLGRARLPQGP